MALAWFYEAGDEGIGANRGGHPAARSPWAAPVCRRCNHRAPVVAVAVLLVRQSDLAGPGSASPAIAVLPFQNLSTAAEGEVLALGIAESVLHQLANLPKLEVTSRTSSFAFGNKQQDAREIGKQLGARFLLEGSVQSDRARMRVTTQLIDTQTGADVLVDALRSGARRYLRSPGRDRAAGDARARAQPRCEGARSPDRPGNGKSRCLSCLPAGRSLQANDRVADTRDAVGHFERATRLDPEFANAYVSLADAKLFVAEYEVTDDRAERFEAALREGRELVQRALAIDPRTATRICRRAPGHTTTRRQPRPTFGRALS